MKILNVLTGSHVLEEVDSPINGHIVVLKDLAWGVYIKANGVTQSGGVVELVWKSALKKVLSSKYRVSRVLILGLGGGSIAKLVRRNWPDAEITGVEIDPIMVELGTRYLGLGTSDVNVKIQDAYKSIKYQVLGSKKYDLICIDLYCGDEFPKKFEDEKFLKLIRKLLSDNSVAIFNRLYYGEKRKEAVRFGKKLEKVFPKVEWFYPEANVMFICSSW